MARDLGEPVRLFKRAYRTFEAMAKGSNYYVSHRNRFPRTLASLVSVVMQELEERGGP